MQRSRLSFGFGVSLTVAMTVAGCLGESTSPTSTPAKLGFTKQPQLTFVGTPTTFRVAIEDSLGNTVTSASGAITVAIGANPGGGTLSGTATESATGGVATFSTLAIDKAGTSYTLIATLSGLTNASSDSFSVGKLSAVSAGGAHTCALTTEGIAYCWGANAAGQLGTADTGSRLTPARVAGGHTFLAISAGVAHTCAVSSGGVAYCWGSNRSGQLGTGVVDVAPHPLPEVVVGGRTFASIGAGLDHTCGITTGGAAYCWGLNALGELGIGAADTLLHPTPLAVSGGLTLATVSVGGDHSCGVTPAGVAYCWGGNSAGGVGDSTLNNRAIPVAVVGGLTFANVRAVGTYLEGDLNSGNSCGLTSGGAAYCWGQDRTASPAPVTGGLTFTSISTFDDVGGGWHVCGVTAAGAAYCWGSNYTGALGDGTTMPRTDPTAVIGGLLFSSISAGGGHSCGITTSGVGYCWGFGFSGALGNDTTANSTAPVLIY